MSIESARKLYQDMQKDPAIRQALDAAGSPNARQAYVKQQGYDFTREEFEKATEEILGKNGALSDADLEKVAGGAGQVLDGLQQQAVAAYGVPYLFGPRLGL